jgi:hypothetical protein
MLLGFQKVKALTLSVLPPLTSQEYGDNCSSKDGALSSESDGRDLDGDAELRG